MNATSQDQLLSKSFSWFTGVVEDISDPMQMGRVRVRCFGYHTEDKSQIETKDLPWAFVVQPVTSAAMGGIGTSPTGILPGSWVVGFFRDGPSAQDPLILGTIASMPVAPDKDRGFSDPSGQYPKPDSIGIPDIPKQSTNEYSQAASYINRNNFRVENIETAIPPKVSSVAVDEPDSYYNRQTWSNIEVDQVVAPVYPNNRATETKSGHVFEVDDTPGFERISEMHTSGTYREIDATGNITTTVVGNRYTVVFESDNIYIMGSCNITVDGDLKQLVKGNYHLEVEGNKTEYIKGSRQSKIGQSEQTEIGKDLAENITGNFIHRTGGNCSITIDGNKVQIIGGNSDLTVAGDSGLIVVGKHQEYSGGHHETTSSGHLYVVSNENLKLETPSNMLVNIDGTQTSSIGGSLTTTVSGSQTTTVSGSQTTTISGSATLAASSAVNITSTSAISVQATNALTLKGNPLNLGS